MEMSHFVNPFLPYSPFFCLRKLRWRIFGTLKEGRGKEGGGGGGWTPLFSRAFNDRELDLVEHFLQKIQAIRVHWNVEDRVI